MIIDLRDYSQVDENYLRNQAKAIETRNLKKYHKSPDWITILRRLNAAIVTTYSGGCAIDRKKLNVIKKEIEAELQNKIKTVCVPACENHEGLYSINIKLCWVCPICGKPRGEIKNGYSYDGSLRLPVDTWDNPCGHVDYYSALRKEAAQNGLNNGGGGK